MSCIETVQHFQDQTNSYESSLNDIDGNNFVYMIFLTNDRLQRNAIPNRFSANSRTIVYFDTNAIASTPTCRYATMQITVAFYNPSIYSGHHAWGW